MTNGPTSVPPLRWSGLGMPLTGGCSRSTRPIIWRGSGSRSVREGVSQPGRTSVSARIRSPPGIPSTSGWRARGSLPSSAYTGTFRHVRPNVDVETGPRVLGIRGDPASRVSVTTFRLEHPSSFYKLEQTAVLLIAPALEFRTEVKPMRQAPPQMPDGQPLRSELDPQSGTGGQVVEHSCWSSNEGLLHRFSRLIPLYGHGFLRPNRRAAARWSSIPATIRLYATRGLLVRVTTAGLSRVAWDVESAFGSMRMEKHART